jgi:hypothetical protein
MSSGHPDWAVNNYCGLNYFRRQWNTVLPRRFRHQLIRKPIKNFRLPRPQFSSSLTSRSRITYFRPAMCLYSNDVEVMDSTSTEERGL